MAGPRTLPRMFHSGLATKDSRDQFVTTGKAVEADWAKLGAAAGVFAWKPWEITFDRAALSARTGQTAATAATVRSTSRSSVNRLGARRA